jgi:hypothetical protein
MVCVWIGGGAYMVEGHKVKGNMVEGMWLRDTGEGGRANGGGMHDVGTYNRVACGG